MSQPEPSGFARESVPQRLLEREGVLAFGPEGQSGHTAGATTIGSDEYADAARWLYGDLWSPGIEDGWLASAKQEQEFSDIARTAERGIQSDSEAEQGGHWTAQAGDDVRARQGTAGWCAR